VDGFEGDTGRYFFPCGEHPVAQYDILLDQERGGSMDRRVLTQAYDMWNAGQYLEAGRALCDGMPERGRPGWAAAVLSSVRAHVRATPEIDTLLAIARDENWWSEGHQAFRALRDLTLRVQGRDPIYEGVLLLAENVAKVTYNATHPRDHFDADAGWWVAPTFDYVVRRLNDPLLTERAWAILSGERTQPS